MRHVMRLSGTVALAAALALLATACARSPEDLQAEVNDALKEARIDHVAPVWEPQARQLRLQGIVLTPDEKQLAAEVAARTLGSRGTVVNDVSITMRGAPEPAPVVASVDDLEQIDNRIQKDIEALFSDEKVWKGREMDITVHQGTVQLTGSALSQDDKDRITEIVARVAGVKDVVNRMAVKERI